MPSRASDVDLPLLGGQIVTALDRALAHRPARRHQLATRALGKRLHPHRRELLVRSAQLRHGRRPGGPPRRSHSP